MSSAKFVTLHALEKLPTLGGDGDGDGDGRATDFDDGAPLVLPSLPRFFFMMEGSRTVLYVCVMMMTGSLSANM